MATDNDNVIDIDGENGTKTKREEPRKEGDKGKEGEGGKKGKNKKAATYAVLGLAFVIVAYFGYQYYKNNIAGGGSTAPATDAGSGDDGGGASGGGGAPTTPTPTPEETGGLAPIVNIILPNGAPSAVAKVKSGAHKVTGHAAGPKITTPKSFIATAKKLVTLPASGVKVEKAVVTPANADVTKAIGAANNDAHAMSVAEENAAHGHSPNPIVHTVSKTTTPTNLDVTKGIAAQNVRAAAPAPKPAPKAPTHVGNTRKIA
jgi:hypothetical protein